MTDIHKIGNGLVEKMAELQTQAKRDEIENAINVFLNIAELKRRGVLKQGFWGFEVDTPTMIIEVLCDSILSLELEKLSAGAELHQDQILKSILSDTLG